MNEESNSAPTAAHTVTSFDEDLQFLMRRIAEMGGVSERMVEQSVAALVQADAILAPRAQLDDVGPCEGHDTEFVAFEFQFIVVQRDHFALQPFVGIEL